LLIISRSDNLAGTYGNETYYVASETAASTFSIPYASLINNETEFLFMTGDRSKYLVAKYKDLQSTMALPVSYSSGNKSLMNFSNSVSLISPGAAYIWMNHNVNWDPMISPTGNRNAAIYSMSTFAYEKGVQFLLVEGSSNIYNGYLALGGANVFIRHNNTCPAIGNCHFIFVRIFL
jgi:hypothetical protein